MSSFIYKNISLYRVVMQLLYAGRYNDRFSPVKKVLKEKKCASLLELCFGDVVLASFCKDNQIEWLGMDRNQQFVTNACDKGFNAICTKITLSTEFPEMDGALIMGSLYHFKKDSKELILKLMTTSRIVMVNEPIVNFSQKKISSRVAGFLSDSGDGPENFRFTKETIVNLAEEVCKIAPFSFYISELGKKDITIVFEKR